MASFFSFKACNCFCNSFFEDLDPNMVSTSCPAAPCVFHAKTSLTVWFFSVTKTYASPFGSFCNCQIKRPFFLRNNRFGAGIGIRSVMEDANCVDTHTHKEEEKKKNNNNNKQHTYINNSNNKQLRRRRSLTSFFFSLYLLYCISLSFPCNKFVIVCNTSYPD